MDTATLSNAFLLIVTLFGMYISAFWLALIIWTYRDHRARSRDGLASLAAALTVAILNLPGLFIYLLLRPKETLSEAYERSLEEEALLQEIEEKPVCPGCGRPVHPEWQACPHCHTTLKKGCVHCGRMLELAWEVCPYCTTSQMGYATNVREGASPRRAASPAPPSFADPLSTSSPQAEAYPPASETLRFIEEDQY